MRNPPKIPKLGPPTSGFFAPPRPKPKRRDRDVYVVEDAPHRSFWMRTIFTLLGRKPGRTIVIHEPPRR
jgi:hypothetical protein